MHTSCFDLISSFIVKTKAAFNTYGELRGKISNEIQKRGWLTRNSSQKSVVKKFSYELRSHEAWGDYVFRCRGTCGVLYETSRC